MGAAVGGTPRTGLRRERHKEVTDRSVRDAVLDAGLVAHVGVLDDGSPVVVPVAYARDGGRLVLHGSTASRLFRLLASGVPACATVTVLDGLVYARSVFNSSMNYRSVMVFGRAAAVPDVEKEAALRVLSEHLMPGRWADARRPNAKELAATLVVALPLDETSVKVGTGPPDDDPDDLAWPAWAGVVPLMQVAGAPIAANDRPPPPYLPRPG